MSDKVRWLLIVGCAVVAALHAPTAASLVAQSWSGPYVQSGAHTNSTAYTPTSRATPEQALQTSAAEHARVGSAQLEGELSTWRGGVATGL